MLLERLEEWAEETERKRAELEAALEDGRVRDPVTGTIFTIAFLKTLAISAAVSVGTMLLTRALTPRQKIQQGRMSGELLLQRSSQGEFIPELYGGDPLNYASTWAATTAYSLNAWVKPIAYNGFYYVVTVAGTSGGSQPTWPTTSGQTVTNGSVTFRAVNGGGGSRLAPLIVYASAIRKHVSTTRGGGGGGKGPKPPEVQETTYDIDLGLMWGRGALTLSKMFANTEVLLDVSPRTSRTGVLDPTVLPDDPYGQDLPPDPKTTYTRPLDRFDGALVTDGTGVSTGTVVQGANSDIAIYPGNQTQLQDPTIQSAIDTLYGAGSTPAYRGRALTVHKNFYLTRFNGVVPNFNGIWHHLTLYNLSLIIASWHLRVGLLVSDYDFSGISTLGVRGLGIAQRFQPAGMMETLARIFNVYFFEADKIYGRIQGSASPVATIDDAELGWMEGDEDDTEVLQELDTSIANETDVPRRIDVRFIDPEKDFEPNLQSESRQITAGERSESIEVQITMTAEEAREVAARELYQADVEASAHRFNLPWTYLWLNPGDTVTVTRDEGFTHTIRLTSIKQAIGVLECEGVAEETAVFVQPVSTAGGQAFEIPPVPIPAMTVIGFYDGPLLRDEENTDNNGAGIYAWAVKRTGEGAWNGAALYVDRGLGEELIATFEKQATAGRAATVLASPANYTVPGADAVTVDLFGTEAALSSSTLADLLNGDNPCLIGDEVCQILTATRDTSDLVAFPNRWNLVIGLRARRGTEFAIGTHVVNERFVLINDAVKFVPLNLNEFNVEREYKAVTSGQSLDDAAVIDYTWTGGSRKDLSPVDVTRRDDSADNSLIEWAGRRRLGFGIRDGALAFNDRDGEVYEMEVYSDATRTVVKRVMRVVVGLGLSAALEAYNLADPTDKFSNIAVNTLSVSGASGSALTVARSLQQIRQPGNFVEATLQASGSAGASLALIGAAKQWRALDPADSGYMVTVSSSGAFLEVTVDGVTVFSIAYTGGDAVRVRITLSGSEVRFYRDWTGAGTPPLYVSKVAPEYPLMMYGSAGFSGAGVALVEKVTMTTAPDPKTIYSLAQQTEDFGGAQAIIYANIYQISPEVGRGYPARVTLVSS